MSSPTTPTTPTAAPRFVNVASGRPFTSTNQWGYRAQVDADGTVRVFDDVAHFYTVCHALTRRQIAHVRRVAAAQS